jgi:hypothetical protein
VESSTSKLYSSDSQPTHLFATLETIIELICTAKTYDCALKAVEHLRGSAGDSLRSIAGQREVAVRRCG